MRSLSHPGSTLWPLGELRLKILKYVVFDVMGYFILVQKHIAFTKRKNGDFFS